MAQRQAGGQPRRRADYGELLAQLLAAIERFPAEAWPRIEYAALANTQQDRTAVEARWAAVRPAWPDRRDG
jgi:hypothetical protein